MSPNDDKETSMSTPIPIFVATRQTQGQRDNDFCFVPEGEIVTYPVFTCDSEEADGACGCRRSLCGVRSSTGTTTMKVALLEGGRTALEQAIRSSLRSGGWPQVGIEKTVAKIITAASQFPVGTVVEWRDDTFTARKS
jgi:hypothetical protein